jgi:hypothetical protein
MGSMGREDQGIWRSSRPSGPDGCLKNAGTDCRRRYFEDGYSPAEAFAEDQSYD